MELNVSPSKTVKKKTATPKLFIECWGIKKEKKTFLAVYLVHKFSAHREIFIQRRL